MPIKLIVGLGNPGDKYLNTRHNVGFWLLELINSAYGGVFKPENKFFGQVSKISIAGTSCYLLKPDTFVNLSGQATQALAHFYKITTDEFLVLHDELDLPVGSVRLKTGGGHGGHNGLRDIINRSGNKDFHRLRIGIDHPGSAKQVSNYVLSKPSIDDKISIDNAISKVQTHIPNVIAGRFAEVMNLLHTTN